MSRYIAIIDYDEGEGLYGAMFPDAPGCTAMGASEDEICDNAAEALSEWMADWLADGNQPPVARSYIELLKSGEFPELGKGGMIATIPLILETGRVTRANISIDEGLLTKIDEAASRQGITRSAFLAAAARERLVKVPDSKRTA